MQEFMTLLLTSEEYKPYAVGGLTVTAIPVMVKILTRLYRDK
jgi:hypothetical protein